MLAGCFCGALNVSAWEVTDTVVADGYYYIRLDYYPDGNGHTGCAVIKQCEASAYTAFKTLYIANMQLVNIGTSGVTPRISPTALPSITSRTAVRRLRPTCTLTAL